MNRTVDTNAQSVRHLENLHVRHGADAGVILVQVDQLARINHSAGTETGNALLDEVARRLETFAADEFGHGSFVGRLEGPRFLIVPAVPLSLGALRAQERALHVALAEPMVGDPNGRLAIRIVTALITRDEPVEEQLRAAADQLARPASARDGVMVKSALAIRSAKHLPGFKDNAGAIKGKGIDTIACLSVNDAFVMRAWGESQTVGDDIVMLADGSGDFTKAVGLEMDASKFGMGSRSQRYSMIVDDGVVKELNVEQAGEFRVSAADYLLAQL